jgi:predicted metal-binding protein
MAEPKIETVVSASEIKKLEERLSKQRDAFKAQTLAQISELLSSLKEVGFTYELAEQNGTSKPRLCGNCGQPGHNAAGCQQPKKA